MVLQRFRDMPGEEDVSTDAKEKILYIALHIGKNILIATDAIESLGQKVNPGTNVYLCLNPDSKKAGDTVFQKLSQGGNEEMTLADQFWGDYFGSLTDKYGINWMIAYNPNRPQK